MSTIESAIQIKVKPKHKRPKVLSKWIVKLGLWAFLLVIGFISFFPILVALLGSVKTNAEINVGATILPKVWQFSNYTKAWKFANFAQFTWNSLYLSAAVTIGTLLIASMAAYAVDRGKFHGVKLYVILQASTMFISIGAVVLRPQFEMMVHLHLQKSLLGVILILISSHAAAYFMMIGFFTGIPKDLDEAAYIDGCHFYSVYWRIILPLLRPALAVVGLFSFRGAWNEYILPLVFTMTNKDLQPLTVGLAGLRYGITAASQTDLMMAGACLSVLPILIVYIFANKAFMQMTNGSVKG